MSISTTVVTMAGNKALRTDVKEGTITRERRLVGGDNHTRGERFAFLGVHGLISTTHSFDTDIALWYIGEQYEGWFGAFCYGVLWKDGLLLQMVFLRGYERG